MYRLKVQTVGNGQHPSEVLVSLTTADGEREELIVDRRSIQNGTLRVGYPIRVRPGRYLVELPRETIRGSWRVWVKDDDVVTRAA